MGLSKRGVRKANKALKQADKIQGATPRDSPSGSLLLCRPCPGSSTPIERRPRLTWRT